MGKIQLFAIANGHFRISRLFSREKIDLMRTLEYIRVYIDDLLIITKSSYEDHLKKVREVLHRLKEANLCMNATKSYFCESEIEYLGYILTR